VPALIVDYCFNSLNWLEQMKLFEMAWNCNSSSITFLMSFLRVFNRMIDWNILGELYEVLSGLGIIIDDNNLKCNSQYCKLIHTLTMLVIFFKYILSLMITLRCFQDTLSGLVVDKLLYLVIALLNFLLENRAHIIAGLVGILFNISELTCWLCTELKDWWRACHRPSSFIYG